MNPDVIIKNENTIIQNISILNNNNNIAVISSVIFQNGKKSIESSGWKIPKLKDIIISNTIIIKKLLQNKGKVSEKTDSGNIKFVEAVHGSFFIFKKTILENDLLFDNNVFLYYEENILGIKLKNKKLLAAINLDDIYYHNHKYKEETLKKIINTSKNRRNSQQYFMKHYLKTFFLLRWFVYLQYNIYIYIELPLCKIIKKIL